MIICTASYSLFACLAFTPFLPSGKLECASWRRVGEEKGESKPRGYLTLTMCVVVTLVSKPYSKSFLSLIVIMANKL